MTLIPLDVENIKEIFFTFISSIPSYYYKQNKYKSHLKGTILRAIRIYNILYRDNFKCVKCGSEINLTIDHPRGRKFAKHDTYQKYKLDKCRTLCIDCHEERNKRWEEKLKKERFINKINL